MKKKFPLLVLTLLLAACSSLSVQKQAGTNLAGFKKIYVEHRLADGRGVDQLITQELSRLGYDASSGPLTMTPPDTEVVLTYVDEWNWDFTLYMIDLGVQVRDARSGQVLATAHYDHPAMGGKSPAGMVKAVIDPLFEHSTSNIQHPTPK
ncbi:MAG TPA: hypothetical protein VNV14_00410 [Opitutaceae bacterium]|jgi:hypothetical protein|nr:hypothetical protein [Opitutaceae bacterium]